MASNLSNFFRRHPLVLVALLVVVALIAAKGGVPRIGLWDGPI